MTYPRRPSSFATQSARRQRRHSATAAATLGAAALALAAWTGGPTLATGATTPTSPATPTTPTTPVNPTPPKAMTGAVAGTSQTGTTLTALITPGGADTTYRFEYGTSTAYGLRTADAIVAAGTDAVTVEAPIAGLTAGTSYHYRVVATNAAGVTPGANRTFTTSSLPRRPAVATRTPSPLAPTEATLVGRVNPYGQATTAKFEWGTSRKLGRSTATQSVAATSPTVTITAPLAGLKANTRYYFRTVATNKTGTARSSIRSFTTSRGLSGVSITSSSRKIAWDGSIGIGGSVGGQAPGGVTVALLRQDHPFTAAFREVATAKTTSSGKYGFTVSRVYASAKFQTVVKGSTTPPSPTVTIGSQVLVKLRSTRRKAASVRLSGVVLPATLPNTARVSVQRKTPKGRWIRVKRVTPTASAKGKLRFAVTVKRTSKTRTYRAVVLPNDGGAHVQTASQRVAVPRKR